MQLEGRERLTGLEASIENGEKESRLVQDQLVVSQNESEQASVKLSKAESSLKDLDQKTKKMQEKLRHAES